MPVYKIIVTGRVQGVGFRAFTQNLATSLGVKGYVRNLRNGNVEVVAEADEDTLKMFCNRLKQGPPAAVVQDFLIDEMEGKSGFNNFAIKY